MTINAKEEIYSTLIFRNANAILKNKDKLSFLYDLYLKLDTLSNMDLVSSEDISNFRKEVLRLKNWSFDKLKGVDSQELYFVKEIFKVKSPLSYLKILLTRTFNNLLKLTDSDANSISNSFALYLKKLRHSSGYSLKEVSDITGISIAYLSRIESGQRKNLGYSIMKRLAQAYDVDISLLVQKENEKSMNGDMNSHDPHPAITTKDLKGYLIENRFFVGNLELTDEEKELIVRLIEKAFEYRIDKMKVNLEIIDILEKIANSRF